MTMPMLDIESELVEKMKPHILEAETTKAIASLLAEHGGRLAILSAEGGIFDILAGRYSGGIPAFDVFLKGHAGDPLKIDRKGRPPEYIKQPSLTMCLAVQPAVLTSIGCNPHFAGRGLLARYLYALPANNVGQRLVGLDPVQDSVLASYGGRVRRLAESLAGWTDPAKLVLTPEAAQVHLDLERALEPRLAPHGDLGGIADWAAKVAGATARLAGLLHLADDPDGGFRTPISATEMQSAVRIAEYFIDHALAAFRVMGADGRLDNARHV